jgi:DHA1 family multidrug resistance protein-like MFS transporter
VLNEPTTRRTQDWRVLLAIYSVTSLVEAFGVSQVFAFLPLRLRDVGVAPDLVLPLTGLFTALIFVFGIFLVPFWGVWADKISRRAVIVRSAVVEAIVFAGVALAAQPWQLAVALLLTGLQLGNTGVMLAALRDVAPPGRIGTISATFGAMSPVGFAIGPVVGGFMVDGLGYPLASIFWTGTALSVGIVLLLLGASREVRPEIVPAGRTMTLAVDAVRGALGDPTVRRLFAIFGVAILGNQMIRPYLPLLVQDLVGVGPGLASAIGLVVGTVALAGALVSPLSGPLGDRVGLRAVLVGALLLDGLSIAPMPFAGALPVLAALGFVYAASYAAVQAMVFALVATEAPPERRSATLNLVLLPLYVAGIVGPSLAAGLAATAGLSALYPVAGGIMALSALVLAGIVRAPRRRMAKNRPDGGG